jgi:hypothetical protein
MREVQYLAFIANSFGRNLLASSTNRLPSILVSSKKRSRCIEPELWKRWAPVRSPQLATMAVRIGFRTALHPAHSRVRG